MAKKEFAIVKRNPMIPAFEVEVMAKVKGYAMVRRKGCYPFIVSIKDLKEKDNG